MKGGTERVTQREQQEQRPPEERECGVDRKARAAGALSDPRERGPCWEGQLGGSGEALGVSRRSRQLFQDEDKAIRFHCEKSALEAAGRVLGSGGRDGGRRPPSLPAERSPPPQKGREVGSL